MTWHGSKLVALAALLYAAASLSQEIFKWIDENGVVHYGESAPEGIEDYERVSITPPPAATPAPPRPQAANPSEPAGTEPPPEAPRTPVVTPKPASAVSLEELDRICDDARERQIAPLKAAAIEECKATPRNDPAYCERFNADFGEGGRTTSGAVRPRMFNDLPECVQAQQERDNRGR